MKFILFILLCASLNVYATGMTTTRANQFADAIYKAEGGTKTKHPYGILSVKTNNPRQVCINTVKANWLRFQKQTNYTDFVEFLGSRYAPTKNATNDPNSLNKNWVKNVKHFLK